MSTCTATNEVTGSSCALPAGHPPPHKPAAALREVDRAVAAGRRNNRREETPVGTYPVPPKPPRVCVYGCQAPALFYPCGARCAEHAPGVTPATTTTQDAADDAADD